MTRRWLKRGLIFIAIVVFAWLAAATLLGVAVLVIGRQDHAEPSDVIVVLGSGLRRDSSPGPSLYRRTLKGARLYEEGIAPRVICTGGFTAGHTRSEADACRELLESEGVPASAITLEERSRSTIENALYTREIMDANGWQTAVVVSDTYHLLRAAWIFRDAGIQAITSPADTEPPRYGLFSAVVREIAALHLQALVSLFGLPVTYVPLF
jgi:uncharacterized SAM-binding protein YcdF (DUF218 family)